MIGLIDKYNDFTGKAVSWLLLFMVGLTFITVIQRYVFNSNYAWENELILFMHSLVFLASSGFCLKENGHVRVDVFYERCSTRSKAIIDLIGTILLIFPVCFAIFYFSYDFIINSWGILESSRENDGLGGIFLLKTSIYLFALNLFLQGISTIMKSLGNIR